MLTEKASFHLNQGPPTWSLRAPGRPQGPRESPVRGLVLKKSRHSHLLAHIDIYPFPTFQNYD